MRKERSKGWCAKELASPQTAPEVRGRWTCAHCCATSLHVLRSFQWRTGGGTPPRTSDACSVSSAVVFFLWRRTKLSRNASPFLNEFHVNLGVKKLHGTYDSSFLEWRLDTFSASDLSHLQREVWELYSVLVIVMTCCIHSEARICSTRNRFQWSFQHCGKKVKKKKRERKCNAKKSLFRIISKRARETSQLSPQMLDKWLLRVAACV